MTDFFTEETIRARKQHKCSCCGESIEAGAEYQKIGGVFDGSWWGDKQHSECRKAEVALSAKYGCWGGEDWIFLNDLDDKDDLLFLEAEHPIAFDRLKRRYHFWFDGEAE